MDNIYLVGFMGTGKSTVAAEMSKLLPYIVVEMDSSIEKLIGKSISDIFATEGEEAFRNYESMFLNVISREKKQIISCGGGVVLRQENIDVMKKNGVVILLEASPEVICERVNKSTDRPLLEEKKTVENIAAMLEGRKAAYAASANTSFNVDDKTPAEIASEIIRYLALEGYLH